MLAQNVFQERRHRLLSMIGSKSLAIIQAAPQIIRNGDSHYAYRQSSHFYYLTGFHEPDAIAVLIPRHSEGEYLLFSKKRDPIQELWQGPIAGQEGAREWFGADQAFDICEFEKNLSYLLENRDIVFFEFEKEKKLYRQLLAAVKKMKAKTRFGIHHPDRFADVTTYLDRMRLIKGKEEIACIKKAVDISVTAHQQVMQRVRPGMKEYELEAILMQVFYQAGSRSPAYNNIVASGPNACVLHYTANNRVIQDQELVLIDAAAEYELYAADITRTFPANGHFTSEQKAIYEIVLAAQLQALACIRPGLYWQDIQSRIVEVIVRGLMDLKILQGTYDDLVASGAYKSFYMHQFGHWLGMDVHDVGSYHQEGGTSCLLQPGMVLTVEPGLYMAPTEQRILSQWRGIGVRIEDDVLVTEQGCQVLSEKLPKTVVDIEHLMKQ